MELRVAGITKDSVVDGPGLRLVIFVQGCPHHCPDCHNPQTHDPNGGTLMDIEEIAAIVSKTRLIRGVTFSGGEPFMQAAPLARLAEEFHNRGLNIVTYTGFVYEQLLAMGLKHPPVLELLRSTDILVDGPYRQEERDLQLAFRGSGNQRLIDVPQSFHAGKVVLWEEQSQDYWA